MWAYVPLIMLSIRQMASFLLSFAVTHIFVQAELSSGTEPSSDTPARPACAWLPSRQRQALTEVYTAAEHPSAGQCLCPASPVVPLQASCTISHAMLQSGQGPAPCTSGSPSINLAGKDHTACMVYADSAKPDLDRGCAHLMPSWPAREVRYLQQVLRLPGRLPAAATTRSTPYGLL